MSKNHDPKGRGFDKHGNFIPDPTELAPPVDYVPVPSLWERVRQFVSSERANAIAAEAGAETFEEADDFDTGEDMDPGTPYEEVFEGLTAQEILDPRRKAFEEERVRRREAAAPKPSGDPTPPPAPPQAPKPE